MFILKKMFLKALYRLLIFKVIIIDKSKFVFYHKLNTFCELNLPSNMGDITFVFKEDRRKHKRKLDYLLMFNNFLIELKVPDGLEIKQQEINDKVIIVIKFILFKVNYQILAEVLLDIYIKSILEYIEKKNTECA